MKISVTVRKSMMNFHILTVGLDHDNIIEISNIEHELFLQKNVL